MDTNLLPSILDGEDKSSLLKNCLRNNYRHLRKWAQRTKTTAFRLYDKDIKEVPLAIDFYEGRFCLHYFEDPMDETGEKEVRLQESATKALQELFGAKPNEFFWRVRKKRERVEQYERRAETGHFFTVHEYGIPFWVNLEDYLDTGLFLDHREARHFIGGIAKGKRVLNLFCYTGAFTVHAALGGALYTKSVDLSSTYTDWARKNLELNHLSHKDHVVHRADCLAFLEEERERYDLIIIDPPTLSRSKKMDELFDIQEDYVYLIERAEALLVPEGKILFSTNSRKFHFDESAFANFSIRDISAKTLPLDYRDPKIRRCWFLEGRVSR